MTDDSGMKSRLNRIIENPLDFLRPTWRASLVYFAILALIGAAVGAMIEQAALPHKVPGQPAGR
jgi:hypothetical protein